MKILIASRNERHGGALAAQLGGEAGAFVITVVADGENLLDAVRRYAPDVVIADMARPDRDSLEAVQAGAVPPVVMFTDEDDPGFMQEAIAAGVSSYHGQDTAPLATKLVMRLALAFFQRTQQVSSRLAEVEERAAARRAIDAAKRLLMSQDKMSEPAAHRFLQRRAMDQQKRIAEVAVALLAARAREEQKNG